MMYRVFIILFFDLIAFAVILPLLPSILNHYEESITEGNEDSLLAATHRLMNWTKQLFSMPNLRKYNNVLIGGLLGSLFSFLQFIANPFIGCLADIFGRRKTMIVCMTGTLLSYFVWLKSDSFKLFLLSRIIGGLCKGSVTVSTTIMTDITSKENRGKAMALIGIAFGIGFTIGPTLGAYFAMQQSTANTMPHPFHQAAMFSLVLQLVALILVVLFLEETKTSEQNISLSDRLSSAMELANPVTLLKSCFIQTSNTILCTKGQLTLIHFFYLLFFAGLEFTLTFLTHERFNFSSKEQGKLFLFIGIVMMLFQGGFVRRVKHGKEKVTVIIGIFSMIPSMMIISFATSIIPLLIGLFFFSFGSAIVIPCLTALFSKYSMAVETGEMLGVFRSAGALARAIGPLLMCSVYWTFGSNICYFVGGCLFIVPLFLCTTLAELRKKE